MAGPKVAVSLDAQAVAGLLWLVETALRIVREDGSPHREELVAQQVGVRQALEGALRAHGWQRSADGTQWVPSHTPGRRR